ncbi:putative lyase [Dioscorea sansibarensis]
MASVLSLTMQSCLNERERRRRRRRWGCRDLTQPQTSVSYASRSLQVYTSSIHPSLWHMESQGGQGKQMEVIARTRKRLNNNNTDPIETMSLIDDLQRLGISYHFDEEIEALSSQCFNFTSGKDDLFGTSLCFRLLRQQGHNASIDMFLKFTDNNGRFNEGLSKDLRGLRSLH